jgi:uncharacterized protein (TIGR00369 family)
LTPLHVRNPDFEASVRQSFQHLTFMHTVGARLLSVAPGEVDIELPFRNDLTQHHGFLAAAVLTAIVDVACGYAAMTLMAPGASVLTVEYKVNFLTPAQGERMLARGRVLRPGRTVTVCAGDVVAIDDGKEKLVATMLATMATVHSERREIEAVGSHQIAPAYNNCVGRSELRDSLPARRAWCVCRGGRLRQRVKSLVARHR